MTPFRIFKSAIKLSFLIGTFTLLSCTKMLGSSSKVSSKPKASAVEEKSNKIAPASIQENWQKDFLNRLTKDKTAKEAWGLFSYGGWASAGQIMVIAHEDNSGLVLYAGPGSKKIDKKSKVSKADLNKFHAATSRYASLKKFETGTMDGLQYEYVHLIKNKEGEAQTTQRTFMNNPGIGKTKSDHINLIKLFNAQVKK